MAKLRDLKSESLSTNVDINKGDWYDVSLVEKIIDNLTAKVGELGYAFVDIRPKISRNRDNKEIDIIFDVLEGKRTFVERIDVSGLA